MDELARDPAGGGAIGVDASKAGSEPDSAALRRLLDQHLREQVAAAQVAAWKQVDEYLRQWTRAAIAAADAATASAAVLGGIPHRRLPPPPGFVPLPPGFARQVPSLGVGSQFFRVVSSQGNADKSATDAAADQDGRPIATAARSSRSARTGPIGAAAPGAGRVDMLGILASAARHDAAIAPVRAAPEMAQSSDHRGSGKACEAATAPPVWTERGGLDQAVEDLRTSMRPRPRPHAQPLAQALEDWPESATAQARAEIGGAFPRAGSYPTRLWTLVADAPDAVVRFAADGGIDVRDPAAFAELVRAEFGAKMPSFVRQLGKYGFRLCETAGAGGDLAQLAAVWQEGAGGSVVFWHPMFQAGQREMLPFLSTHNTSLFGPARYTTTHGHAYEATPAALQQRDRSAFPVAARPASWLSPARVAALGAAQGANGWPSQPFFDLEALHAIRGITDQRLLQQMDLESRQAAHRAAGHFSAGRLAPQALHPDPSARFTTEDDGWDPEGPAVGFSGSPAPRTRGRMAAEARPGASTAPASLRRGLPSNSSPASASWGNSGRRPVTTATARAGRTSNDRSSDDGEQEWEAGDDDGQDGSGASAARRGREQPGAKRWRRGKRGPVAATNDSDGQSNNDAPSDYDGEISDDDDVDATSEMVVRGGVLQPGRFRAESSSRPAERRKMTDIPQEESVYKPKERSTAVAQSLASAPETVAEAQPRANAGSNGPGVYSDIVYRGASLVPVSSSFAGMALPGISDVPVNEITDPGRSAGGLLALSSLDIPVLMTDSSAAEDAAAAMVEAAMAAPDEDDSVAAEDAASSWIAAVQQP